MLLQVCKIRIKLLRACMCHAVSWRGEVHLPDFLGNGKALAERSRGITAVPSRVELDSVDLRGPKELVKRRGLRRAKHGDSEIHELGISYDPFKRLHAAHGDAHHRAKMREMQHLSSKAMFRLNHI